MMFLVNEARGEFAKIGEKDSVKLVLELIKAGRWWINDPIALINKDDVRDHLTNYVDINDSTKRLGDLIPVQPVTTRRPSPYNDFMKAELARIKAENPDIAHKMAFKMSS
jgi:hypothetical protein